MKLSLGHAPGTGTGFGSAISLTPFARGVIIALMLALCAVLGSAMDLTMLVMALGLFNIGVVVFLLLQKDITWGFIFYLTAVIFFQQGFWIRLPAFPDLYPARIASILLYLVFLGQILMSIRTVPPLNRVEKTMIVFLVVMFISVVTSGQKPHWLTLLRAYIYPFLFFYFARSVINREAQVRIVLAYLSLVGIYFGVMGIFEKLKWYEFVWPQFIVDPTVNAAGLARLGHRVRGIFIQPAVLGCVMTMGLFPSWHFLSRIGGVWPFVTKVVLVLVTLPTLYFTQTRSVYAGFALALVNTAIWSRKLRPLCITVLLAGAVGAFLSWDRLSSSDRDEGGLGTVETVHYRIIIFYEALDVFMDHPFFGCGFMTFQEIAKEYRKPRDVPFFGNVSLGMQRDAVSHNILMTVFAEQGALGIVPYALIFFFFFHTSWRAYRTLPNEGLISKDFVVCVWAAMVAYFVNAMLMEMRYFEYINVLFYFTMGMMMGIYERWVAGRAEELVVAEAAAAAPRLQAVPHGQGAR
jgi:O-antigen ligase